MSNKQKKANVKARQERKALRKSIASRQQARVDGRLIQGQIMPIGAIAADASKQTSCSAGPWHPKLWYKDRKFTCRDCGKKEVWTAMQQKLWYEDWGGNIESTAVRCRSCRKQLTVRRNANKPDTGDGRTRA